MKRKYLITALAFVLNVGIVAAVQAQEKKKETVGESIDKTGKAIGKTATKVGNKTAEVAVKGGANVVDQVYKGKVAPDGSKVFIDGKNKKYYINKKGAKIYLKPLQIKDKS